MNIKKLRKLHLDAAAYEFASFSKRVGMKIVARLWNVLKHFFKRRGEGNSGNEGFGIGFTQVHVMGTVPDRPD